MNETGINETGIKETAINETAISKTVITKAAITKTMKRKTALYCRTASNSLTAIESQLDILLRYGQEMGYDPSVAYCDENENGSSLDRPYMQKLLSDIRAGEVGCIIVRDISRLTRSSIDSFGLINLFDEYGVELISIYEGVISLAAVKQFIDVFMTLATQGNVGIGA